MRLQKEMEGTGVEKFECSELYISDTGLNVEGSIILY